MKKKPSQTLQIYRAMKRGKTVTPMDALELCGCFRLSARIADLKEMGCLIENREKHGHYARYKLVGFASWTDAKEVLQKLKVGAA